MSGCRGPVLQRYLQLQDQIVDGVLSELADDVLAIFSVGGVARREIKEGWTDLDLLVVVKDSLGRDSAERVVESIGERLTSNETLTLRLGQSLFSPWVFTESEIRSGKTIGCGFEYYNFVRDSIPLSGVDVRQWLRPPTKEEVERTARSALRQTHGKYNGRRGGPRSPFTTQTLSSEMVEWLFSVSFPVTRMLLALRGYFIASKREMAEHASLLADISGWEVVPQAYREWKGWHGKMPDRERFRQLCQDLERYLDNSFTKELADN